MMTGKRIFAVLAVLAALSFQAAGQNTSSVDSTLVGRSIFNLLPSREKGNKATVTVRQSPEIKEAFRKALKTASEERKTGEPLDWTEHIRPLEWRFDGEETVQTYNWK